MAGAYIGSRCTYSSFVSARFSIMLVHLLLAAALCCTVIAHAQDPDFHLYLCLGQSNMEGYPGIPEDDRAFNDARFQVLASVDFPELGREQGHWYTAVPPLCRPDSGMSPADGFGRTLIAQLPPEIRVGVVSVAVAGAKLEVFDPARVDAYTAESPDWLKGFIAIYGGNPYQHLIKMARRAQSDGVIRGILLHQGESNAGDETWPAQVKDLYERLLADLDLRAEHVPLLVGELVGADQNGACAGMNEIIATVPDLIPSAHVVSSAGCAALPDVLHFQPAGYLKLGRRYAETLLPLLDASSKDYFSPSSSKIPKR